MEKELKVGDLAPDFNLNSQDGKKISLKNFRGKKVVLYFYPKDMTPGCTKEACSFRDNYESIMAKGAIVLGISADSVDSHRKFREKFKLPFDLLSDETKEVSKLYGVWKQKSFLGKKFMGIERSTFIIDEKGKILAIFRKVKVNGHTEEVLNYL
ncbi:MAG: Thiol peroxidase, Bcp-type [Ignavibacteriae bacterium]|nr:MAG: Thiol peroxidase, Bcp-type [Ignavibacteriota bacterium]